ncbi:hypothetical protein, partial [Plasmodium yoelii yoelii]
GKKTQKTRKTKFFKLCTKHSLLHTINKIIFL